MKVNFYDNKAVSENNKAFYKTPIPSMLKTNKDFTKFGKQVASRFSEQCQGKTELDDAKMEGFMN